jgi:hypothetical protein
VLVCVRHELLDSGFDCPHSQFCRVKKVVALGKTVIHLSPGFILSVLFPPAAQCGNATKAGVLLSAGCQYGRGETYFAARGGKQAVIILAPVEVQKILLVHGTEQECMMIRPETSASYPGRLQATVGHAETSHLTHQAMQHAKPHRR